MPEDKIHVVYNGIDTKIFNANRMPRLREEYRKSVGVEDDLPVLLFVGSGFERKGLSYLIEAIDNLKNRNLKTKLLIIGKDKVLKYKRLAKKLNVDEDIVFAGPQKDVRYYYSASDIFVLPTLYDPFSNATLEAMACGLPVVTSRFNGASEVVEKEGMGCTVQNPTDQEEIARKIEEALSMADKKELKNKGKDIAQRYSIEKTVKEFMKVLEMTRS
jgi:UDP-glucose:(heptosyl)LPS alpha-1,3-glucosyltransferase